MLEGDLIYEVRSGIALNRQTGLFEQTVRVVNNRAIAIPAFRMSVTNVPPDWTVWNAHGLSNGIPFFRYDAPLDPGAFVDLLIEFRIPDRNPAHQPDYIVEADNVIDPPPNPTGAPFTLTSRASFADGAFLLEFSTLTNRLYTIQYSPDMAAWQEAVP